MGTELCPVPAFALVLPVSLASVLCKPKWNLTQPLVTKLLGFISLCLFILFLLPGLERPIPRSRQEVKASEMTEYKTEGLWDRGELERVTVTEARTQPGGALFDCWPILLDILIFERTLS